MPKAPTKAPNWLKDITKKPVKTRMAVKSRQNSGIPKPPEDQPEDLQDIDFIKETLRSIMRDADAPAAAKAQAARTLAEMMQALGRHAAPATATDKPIADMGRDELEAELARFTS